MTDTSSVPQSSQTNNPRARKAAAQAQARAHEAQVAEIAARVIADAGNAQSVKAAESAEEAKLREKEEALEAAKKAADALARLEGKKALAEEADVQSQAQVQVRAQRKLQSSEKNPQETRPSVKKESKLSRHLREEKQKQSAKKPQAAASEVSEPDEVSESSKKSSKNKETSTGGLSKRVKIIIAVVASAVFAIMVALVVTRWVMVDDVTDIQGTWYVTGTEAPVTITDTEIQLAEGVSYEYIIDPTAKTLSFAFNDLQGTAHYRFSLDRQQLAILDGEYGMWNSLGSDIGWLFQLFVAAMQGKDFGPAGNDIENVIGLSREATIAEPPAETPAEDEGEVEGASEEQAEAA